MVQNNRGFTLVELVVVFVVTGLLSAFAIASYQGAQRRMDAEGLASSLFGSLQVAKAESSLRGEPVGCALFQNGAACFTLAPGADTKSPAIAFSDGAVTTTTGDVAEILFQQRFNASEDIDNLPATGYFSSTPGLFYFHSDGSVLDGHQQPTQFVIRLQDHENESHQSVLRIRSTGAITKEL